MRKWEIRLRGLRTYFNCKIRSTLRDENPFCSQEKPTKIGSLHAVCALLQQWHGACSQARLHYRAIGSRTIWGARVYEVLLLILFTTINMYSLSVYIFAYKRNSTQFTITQTKSPGFTEYIHAFFAEQKSIFCTLQSFYIVVILNDPVDSKPVKSTNCILTVHVYLVRKCEPGFRINQIFPANIGINAI